MEERKPQKGDTVRIEGVVRYADDRRVDVAVGDHVVVLQPATIQVLEPADDPSKDLKGTVREKEPGVPAVCFGKDFWLFFHELAGYGVARDCQMVGKPVIGATPGTPAAEAELAAVEHTDSFDVSGAGRAASYERATQRARDERQVPMELRQKLADALVAGEKVRAIRIACGWGMDRDDAVAYITAMPEHQTYLNHWHAETAKEAGLDEARKLIVHPHVWKPLVAWLTSTRVSVARLDRFDGNQTPVFAMVPMDGEWGTDE